MQAGPAPQPSDGAAPLDVAHIPPPPVVQPREILFDTPSVLADGMRYSIGWQRWPEKKGGPSFVTVRRTAAGTLKAVERYPLTDKGWARAWLALVKLDPAAAERILVALARRAEKDRGSEERRKLDARSLAYLLHVIFIGGYLSAGTWPPGRYTTCGSCRIGCRCSRQAA